VILDAPNTEGSTMIITNNKNLSDAMNNVEMVKTEGKKLSKDDRFCNYCKKMLVISYGLKIFTTC
jgi:hypothetical protein